MMSVGAFIQPCGHICDLLSSSRVSMVQTTGYCSKCGSSNLKPPRYVRTRDVTSAGVADLNIITRNDC